MLRGIAGWLFGQDKGHDASEGASFDGGNEPIRWVSVLTTLDQVQATIAVARLQDEDIPAQLRQEAASSVYPVGVGILGQIDVVVPEEAAEQAVRVLTETLGPEPDVEDFVEDEYWEDEE